MYKILGGLICLFALCMGDIAAYAESGACQSIRAKRNQLQSVCTAVEARQVGGCQPFKAEIKNLDEELRKNCVITATYDFTGGNNREELKICEIKVGKDSGKDTTPYSPAAGAEQGVYDRVYQIKYAAARAKIVADEDLDTDEKLEKFQEARQDAIREAMLAAQMVSLRSQLSDSFNSSSVSNRDTLRAIDTAILSYDVYFDESVPGLVPDGVSRLSDQELDALGIDPTGMSDTTGYYAAIYKDSRPNADPKYIYVNRGTNFDDFEGDWLQANVQQGAGFGSPQYSQAVQTAADVSDTLAELNEDVIFVGHSLGGGLASAQGLATGQEVIAHNPAGVHDLTGERLGFGFDDENELINAYVVDGEVLDKWVNDKDLTWLSDDLRAWVQDDLGGNIDRTPPTRGVKTTVPGNRDISFGGVDFSLTKDDGYFTRKAAALGGIDLHGLSYAIRGFVYDWCKGKL